MRMRMGVSRDLMGGWEGVLHNGDVVVDFEMWEMVVSLNNPSQKHGDSS